MEASQEVFEVNAVGHALWKNNDKQHISVHTPSLLCPFCEVFPKDNQQLMRSQLREKLMKTALGFSF